MPSAMNDKGIIVSIKQASKLLCKNKGEIYRLINDNTISSIKVDNRTFVYLSEINAVKQREIKSSKHLAQIVCDGTPKSSTFHQKIHPATRVFMALRIAVNRELEMLDSFMARGFSLFFPPCSILLS